MLLQRLLAFICVVGLASGQPTLPPPEVESLKAIAKTLGKKDWNFSVDPCSGLSGWITSPDTIKGHENNVTCDCTFDNNTTCHVTNILLKAQSLNGLVPRELTTLPFLQEIDLTRNYLNGTIPREWGSMTHLQNVSLLGNRISGRIPEELGNITTLQELILEHNWLAGAIPPKLGNLPRLERLTFSSNRLTGEVPENLANLTTLKDFRISDNNFTGRIPTFIGKWTNMEKLFIQASGLTGPIPPDIAFMTNLTDLRISDLSGNESTFPPLENINFLKNLILRSCHIIGHLPPYIGEMTTLKTLDLSFNKLSGPIPESFHGLAKADFIYLTGNSLSGQLPDWMLREGKKIDLSYNNLTSGLHDDNCQPNEINLFASSQGNKTGIVSCLRCLQSEKNYSVHINCGGQQISSFDNQGHTTTYDDDKIPGKASRFYHSTTRNWGYSNTGHFLDDDTPIDTFIRESKANISGPNFQLYQDARLAAISLTYYAFCLASGNYTVNLHFAEIMFTNDNTYESLGRRVFDVYIQRKLVLKDFNIENEAGGVNIGIKRNFTTAVNDGTLDIRFYWAGKGTTAIPSRGTYGPLISAISVESNSPAPLQNTPPSKHGDTESTGIVVGVVVAVFFIAFFLLFILWWKGCLRRNSASLPDLKGLEPYSLRKIKVATNNFDHANKIGEGGFGPVYKGCLPDGTMIAVKQLSSKSKQGNREFVNEIGMISAIQHPHLVKLYGCCIEGSQLLLVYEYMENNSLARALFGPEDQQLHLDWPMRRKICIGIARGLAYLHEESKLKIVHRDIKATNVLLDQNLVPKISDFGLARLYEEDDTHISTRVAGTYGYMAPEYAMRGQLTDKADVYSFGVVVLEIVSGRSNASIRPKEACFNLVDWANSLNKMGEFLELIDPRLGPDFNREEVMTAIHVAFLCTRAVAAERPSMSAAVSMLEAGVPPDSSTISADMRMREKDDEESVLVEVPWSAYSSASTADLYPISLNSAYWNNRDP